ncbi:MAG TPA: hypothetical protein VKR32_14750 [Puia sp.]|nr:hypothetical protein [Puia sp.]
MKKHLALILGLFAVAIIHAQSSNHETLYMTKSLANDAIKNVEAKTSGGSIDVRGGGDQPRIEVYITSSNGRNLPKDEIDQRLKEYYNRDISASNNKLTAIAKNKIRISNWHNALSISFKIYVPQNASTDLSTSGGSIYLGNLNGTEDFSTSGGSLTVSRVVGKITGETSGGSIDVSDSKDDIDLGTSGGSIEATSCTGKIKLSTSGGSLSLHDLNGDIKANTSGGSVDGKNISGELSAHTSGGSVSLRQLSCSVDASTSGGNIDAEIAQVGKYIRLNNSGGNIDLRIPKNIGYDLKLYGDKISTESFEKFSGTIKENKVEGTLNGGGIPVMADAGGGKVSLSFH